MYIVDKSGVIVVDPLAINNIYNNNIYNDDETSPYSPESIP